MYRPDPDPIDVFLKTMAIIFFCSFIVLSWIYVVIIDPFLARMGVGEINENAPKNVSEDSSCSSEFD